MATPRTASDSRQAHAHGWAAALTLGILMTVFGLFAIFAAVVTSILSILFLGGLLAAVGILELVSSFRIGRNAPRLVYLLAGLLTFVVGALFLFRPLAGLESVTLLIAGYLFASGLFRGIVAISERHSYWRWDLVYAVTAIALGAIVVTQWPRSSLLVLGLVVGIEIFARGVAVMSVGWGMRELGREIPGDTAAT